MTKTTSVCRIELRKPENQKSLNEDELNTIKIQECVEMDGDCNGAATTDLEFCVGSILVGDTVLRTS